MDTDADPFALAGLLVVAGCAFGCDKFLLETVTLDNSEDDDEDEGMRPDIACGTGAFWRGVRGMAVCVEAVDEDDAEGVGEAERDDEGIELAGVGIRSGDGAWRASIVSVYRVCKSDPRRWKHVRP